MMNNFKTFVTVSLFHIRGPIVLHMGLKQHSCTQCSNRRELSVCVRTFHTIRQTWTDYYQHVRMVAVKPSFSLNTSKHVLFTIT